MQTSTRAVDKRAPVGLREHIFEGHVYSDNVGGWHHIYGSSDSNSYGRIDNIVNSPDPKGYFTAHVSIKNNSGTWIEKRNYEGDLIDNDMFPRHWTKEELLENISLAYSKKVFTGEGNKYEGIMSDGKKLILCIDNVNKTTEKIRTVWPKR